MSPGSSPLSIEQNFQRIENATEADFDIAQGIATVTGSLVITTRLSRVDSVVACLGFIVPAAGNCFLVAYPYLLGGGGVNQIAISVYTNAFVLSTIATSVSWIATGEMILG